jgi:hypothetical protein
MSRSWLTSLPTAILVLFLLGFPCGSLMMYMQAPAQHCCGDCGDAPQTPPPGCRTLCAASSVTILLQSMDVTAGVPLDAGLLAAAQAVEHYEISRYGTLRTWAEELGLDEAASLLQETLDEEEETDQALTELAKTAVNQQAEAA